MIRSVLILFFTCACITLQAQVNIITTIAGTGVPGYCCDNGPATNAQIQFADGICLDKYGHAYIADPGNNRIRKIDFSTGIITTIAGNGTPGYSGDDSLATNAKLRVPEGVFTDETGNVYIADGLNDRIRKVTIATGIITTIAGNGLTGSAGDGGLAINAELNLPIGLYVDLIGNIFIADYSNNKVRRIEQSTGIITTIAGNGLAGYSGNGGPAINSSLSSPSQIFGNSLGDIFICDQWNHAIRKVTASTGIISTIAGNGTAGYTGDGGLAIHATLNQPTGLFIDEYNNIFIAEYGNGVIRRIDGVTGIITTAAGTGTLGYSGEGMPATSAQLRCASVSLDSNGFIYIADMDNNRIRKVYNPTLGAESVSLNNSGIRLFPNPAKNELVIEYSFTNHTDGTIEILDMTGRVIIANRLSYKNEMEILSLYNLSPGMYLYRITQDNTLIAVGKVVKQ